MTTVSPHATTLVRHVTRQLLREIASVPPDGQPRASSSQLSDPRVYLRVSHRELAPDDPLVANSPVISNSASRHHLYESFVLPLPEADDGGRLTSNGHEARDVLDDTVYTLANPVHSYPYGDSTGWLVTQSGYEMMLEVLALRTDEEQAYLAKAFARPAWTGNNRGMHEPMGVLVRQVTRHPAFTTEELIFRHPTTLLFLTHRGYLNALRRYGISPDVQEEPTRGFFAVDVQSYGDCHLVLSRITNLIAVEFSYQGPCLRGLSPLSIPVYRMPEAIPLETIRTIVEVATGRDLWLGGVARDEG
ncbi:MAG: hypothetical protein NVSMB65_02190 [Chloroflexota bacterium]